MLIHSFDRFYVVTKFILPSANDLRFLTVNFDETCNYLQEKNRCNENTKEYIFNLRVYCKQIVPFALFIRKKSSFNCTVHNI